MSNKYIVFYDELDNYTAFSEVRNSDMVRVTTCDQSKGQAIHNFLSVEELEELRDWINEKLSDFALKDVTK